ncbi:hypothetical protein [Thiohalorhabdus sp.]|uniref:hypothetical protein n=1 Tax=Thiohalorhabdus sp. TaxID=3094134 RepID=UPI002FC348F5
METLGITRFEDLVAHLDGLTDAAWGASLDSEAVAFVAAVRRRLVRIHNYLTDRPHDTEPETVPREKAITDLGDLIEQFGQISEAARGAGLSTTVTHYLHTARLRLRFTLSGQGGRRIINRNERTGEAHLRWDQGQMTAEVVDSSASGFGVVSKNPVPEDAVVEVTTEEEGSRRCYGCVVVFCEQQPFDYHIGLEIFAYKQ